MSCTECGSPCQGSRCAECEMIAACEARHGDRADVDAQDQTTADGGVRKEGE